MFTEKLPILFPIILSEQVSDMLNLEMRDIHFFPFVLTVPQTSD